MGLRLAAKIPLSPVLVPVCASPVPSVVRGSFVVKFFSRSTPVGYADELRRRSRLCCSAARCTALGSFSFTARSHVRTRAARTRLHAARFTHMNTHATASTRVCAATWPTAVQPPARLPPHLAAPALSRLLSSAADCASGQRRSIADAAVLFSFLALAHGLTDYMTRDRDHLHRVATLPAAPTSRPRRRCHGFRRAVSVPPPLPPPARPTTRHLSHRRRRHTRGATRPCRRPFCVHTCPISFPPHRHHHRPPCHRNTRLLRHV